MSSLLRKAARVNLVAMDFMLQVTVEELVLETLDTARTLSFELSRGAKISGLPPKQVLAARSEWNQTMQMHLTLFLDKRASRFQDKEYVLRLVQKDERGMFVPPVLATFTLDVSLYAHLGAGPSVQQQVDLYAPKLNGVGGFATVRLRVHCCEPRRGPLPLNSQAAHASVCKETTGSIVPSSGSGLPTAGARSHVRTASLPPLQSSGPEQLVGSSFGFSVSGSESECSSASTDSSAFSTPVLNRSRRPWSTEESEVAGSMSSKHMGSKSFNELDDANQLTPLSNGGVIVSGLRSNMRYHDPRGSHAVSSHDQSSGHSVIYRTGPALATGVLTSASSSSVTDVGSRASHSPQQGLAIPYDRTTTVGYNRLLARFTKGPSPRRKKPMPKGMTSIHFPLPHMPQGVATAATSAPETCPSRQQPTSTITSTPGINVLGPDGGGVNEGATATKSPSSSSTTPDGTGGDSRDGDDDDDDVKSGFGSVAAGEVTVVPVAKGVADPVRNGGGHCHIRAAEKRGGGGGGVCIVTRAGLLANSSSSYNRGGSSASATESSSLPPNHFNIRTPLVPSSSSATRTSTASTTATATADADAATADAGADAAPAPTATKVVGPTSSSVGINAATVVEETSLIAVSSYRRQSAGGNGSGGGGEVGEGGGGSGGKGALSGASDTRAAADVHHPASTTTTTTTTTITTTNDNNDGSSSANPKRSLSPLGGGLGGASGANDDSGAGAGATTESEGMSGYSPPHSLSGGSTSFSGSGWGSRTVHPMMGAARSKEVMGSLLSVGEGTREAENVGDGREGAGGKNGGWCIGEQSHAAPMCEEYCFGRSAAIWMQHEGSAGGGSAAEAAPLSASVPVIVSEGASLPWVGIGGGSARGRGEMELGAGGMMPGEMRRSSSGQEGIREMRARILHMEAALVRSELDLCRAKTEVATARQEVYAMRRAKEIEDQERPSPREVAALYHAVEGSVILLKMASEKMARLENFLEKYRNVVSEPVLAEIQKCVTIDSIPRSPVPVRMA